MDYHRACWEEVQEQTSRVIMRTFLYALSFNWISLLKYQKKLTRESETSLLVWASGFPPNHGGQRTFVSSFSEETQRAPIIKEKVRRMKIIIR